MRMTNKIMQNNSLYNINNNKVLQDKLSTQMSTQKKITRPSDDPVIAIRALRLRTSVSELTQYYEKNAPDAESWLTVTEDALETGTEVLTDMVKQATKGANKDLGVEVLTIITQQMKQLRDEYYSTGNVDYAGRYVFTGYRTDTTLTFTSEVEDSGATYDYSITEPVKIGDFDSVNYTNMKAVDGLDKSNYASATYKNVTEQQITNSNIHRIRLSYDDLKGEAPTISYKDKDGKDVPLSDIISPANVTVEKTSAAAYQTVANANADAANVVIFVPETGEVLFSDAAYEKLNGAVTSDTEISITYGKDSWKDGDLRPEHYFTCSATITDKNGQEEKKVFNDKGDVESQIIEYDVGYNQKIRVNTLACEAFTHSIDRDIDDLENALASLTEINSTVEDLKTLKKSLTEGTTEEYDTVEQELAAAQKAYDYVRENIHTMFEHTITSAQNYLDEANIAVTDNGARSSRLELVSNRLMEQKTTFQTLQSENEDADISEVAIQLTSTELTYEAALMATGKIMQTSLMNYI